MEYYVGQLLQEVDAKHLKVYTVIFMLGTVFALADRDGAVTWYTEQYLDRNFKPY